jgi:hypothetical protein
MTDAGIRKSSPVYETGSVVQIARRASMFSSACLPRRCQSAPAASYSSGDQPMPRPTFRRPFETTSSVVRVRPSSVGLYQGMLRTLGPIVTRSVAAATNASAVSGSRTSRYTSGSEPSADATYGTAGSTGNRVRSVTQSES